MARGRIIGPAVAAAMLVQACVAPIIAVAATPKRATAQVKSPAARPTHPGKRIVRPYTPAPGTPERTAILDALRPAGRPDYVFKVDTLRVAHGRMGAVAYLIAEPANGEIDGGEYILTRNGGGPKWRVAGADTGGGSNGCAEGARYYRWAIGLFQSYGADPEAMVPGIGAQVTSFEQAARAEPDLQCVGDLSGGPDGKP